jgi:hypothetical protein
VDATTSGPTLRATVGHKPGESWSLVIKVEGQFVATKPDLGRLLQGRLDRHHARPFGPRGEEHPGGADFDPADNALWASISLN